MIATRRPPVPIPVRRAVLAEAADLSRLIAVAFEPLGMTRWLVPEEGDRIPVMAGFLQITVEHAIVYGEVDVAGGGLGVAVWLPCPGPDIDDYDRRLEAACGAYLARFQALDAAMGATHPSDRPHHYLPFVAVHPSVQARGVGGALLAHHHTGLDGSGVPAYLEAADPTSARLYRRHHYTPINRTFGPAGSRERLRPMWREPQHTTRSSPTNPTNPTTRVEGGPR
ncbi:MAG: GNAT family N-acetyltransferase [Dactylosporangium sp.]|nr:GNAT family N-acetyltransferase [Dactylosporangium sp.]NNJ59905.1 GNAT family N-acetyltransferase [Dactylosporangium sp.]